MNQRIAHVSLVVKDYDEAIHFYTEKLEFELIEDTPLGEGKRWVIIAPKGAGECSLLLARAKNEEELLHVGNQTGGRVFLFLFTDDFNRDFEKYKANGVHFVREPQQMEYGTVAVFKDLYGNQWDLIEPTSKNSGLLNFEKL